MRKLFAGLALACLVAPASAVDMHVASPCLGKYADDLQAAHNLLAAHPEITVHEYLGDEATKIVAAFNVQPPETHFVADRLFTAYAGNAIEWITFARGECVIVRGPVSADTVRALLTRALGAGA